MSLAARLRVDLGAFTLAADVHADQGEVLAVLGPNGAGKSTMLRALAGLLPLTAGRVELAGEVIEDPSGGRRLPPQDRRIGMVFQDYRLFPHLSARENVAFGLRSLGTSRASARAQADSWLSRLGLTGLEQRRPNGLSGGQAQRVALARALCTQPRLLLMDEPLAALDVATRSEVRTELREQLARFPGPALLVTHDPLDALALADRLLILEDGRVVQDGPAAHIARYPASPYVARLVGLNLFRGAAVAGVLHVEGGGVLVTGDSALTGPTLAVVRPSSVLLQKAEPGPSSARNVWPGRLASLEAMGDRVRVSIEGPPTLLADVTTQAVAEMRLTAGDHIWVSLKATDINTYPEVAPVPVSG